METRTRLLDIKGSILQYLSLNDQLPADLRSAGVIDDKDAWATPIQYIQLDGGKTYSLISLGTDKRLGGTGYAEDIVFAGP